MIEGLKKTQVQTTNKTCLKDNIIFSSKTYDSRRNLVDNQLFIDMVETLNKFIDNHMINEIDDLINIYAVDGSKLSLSLDMCKYKFPMAYGKNINHAEIKIIKEKYKDHIKIIRDNFNILIKECGKNIDQIKILKDEKKLKIKKLVDDRKIEIKEMKNNKDNETINDEDFVICKSKTKAKYCKALLTSIFDVKNKYCIKMDISKSLNERDHIMNMIDNNIKRGSIMIFDRGYYSEELLDFLHKRQIIPIFRLKSNHLSVQELLKLKTDEYTTTINNIPLKTIKYTINNNDFYIGTTDISLNISKLKETYWLRWSIEEFYKKVKCNTKAKFYKTNSEKRLEQTIKVQQFVLLYTQIIINIIKRNKIDIFKKRKSNMSYPRRNKDINFKAALEICIEEFLYDMLNNHERDNLKIEKILFIYSLIHNSTYIIIPNRSFNRQSIINLGRWYNNNR